MPVYGDESGLLWNDPPKVRGEPPPRSIQLPPSDWLAPDDFPSFDGVKRLAIDLETKDPQLTDLGPGVRRPGNYILGVAIGTDRGLRSYYPVAHPGPGNLDKGIVFRWLRSEARKFKGEVVGARLLYDLDWLASEDIIFPNAAAFHDVQVAEPLINEWRFQYGLDALAKDYLGEGKEQTLLQKVAFEYRWKTDKELKANLWRLPAAYVGAYAEGDVDRPLRILPMQFERLEAEKLMPIYTVERKLIPILLGMRRRGVPVNIERAKSVRARLVTERDGWLAKCRHLAGSSKVEFMQPATFAKALEDRGLKVPRTAKTKEYSITKQFLERNESDELVNAVMEGRKVNTIINTFIDGHVLGHHINGRIHCEFTQLKGERGGTIARFSSSNPNLQNLPARDGELAPLVRSIFEPEPDETWQRDDYDQIEYRLLAHFARGQGAKEVRQKYREDPKTDFHKYTAGVCGIDPEDKVKRKRVKNINFAKVYGAQVPKLAMIMGCSLSEAHTFVTKYENDLPFVKTTFDAAQQWASEKGYVTTILGRKQHFSLWEPWGNFGDNAAPPLPREQAEARYGLRIRRYMTYAALNRKMQGSGADIMKAAMVNAHEAGLFEVIGWPLLTVHDELDNSIPKTKEGEQAAAELTRLMAKVVKLEVPILVGTDRGTNWGNCA